jgi:biopolymer transport protein ExbD
MAMDVGTKKGPKGDINVTPLIDVVLVLLIIFMVLTPSLLKHLTAAVPKKDESDTPAPVADSVIIVEYTANRELSINSEPVSAQNLATKVGDRLRNARQKVVFFKADDEAPYGEVVHLMDVARGAGAETLALVTK